MRRVCGQIRGCIRDAVLDFLDHGIETVGGLFSEQVDAADDLLGLKVYVVFLPVQAPASRERPGLEFVAFGRRHDADLAVGVVGRQLRVAGVEHDRSVRERGIVHADRAAGGGEGDPRLRLDADEIGRAPGADKDRGVGADDIQRAVAAEGDAAAAAL